MRTKTFITILLILFSSILIAQEGRGKGRVEGVVNDEAGKPVEGVKISMKSLQYNFSFETTSNAKGKFVLYGFSKSMFEIRFEKEGLGTIVSRVQFSGFSNNPKQKIVMKKAEEAVAKEEGGVSSESKELFKNGNKLYKAKNYAEALTNFKQFIEKNPEFYQARINIGNCHLMLKQYDKAVPQFLEVVKGVEKDEKAKDKKKVIASAYSSIGEAYMARNMYDKAAEYYTKSMDVSPPTDPAVAFNVAEIMFNAGKTDEAIKLYSIASKLKPDFAMYYSKLGYAYLNKGDIPNAVKFFEKFLKMAPNDPQAASVKDLVSSLKQ